MGKNRLSPEHKAELVILGIGNPSEVSKLFCKFLDRLPRHFFKSRLNFIQKLIHACLLAFPYAIMIAHLPAKENMSPTVERKAKK